MWQKMSKRKFGFLSKFTVVNYILDLPAYFYGEKVVWYLTVTYLLIIMCIIKSEPDFLGFSNLRVF